VARTPDPFDRVQNGGFGVAAIMRVSEVRADQCTLAREEAWSAEHAEMKSDRERMMHPDHPDR
jgi:hypothetical protein